MNGNHSKWRFANARPDPVFRYRSKRVAVRSSSNCSATTSCHGLNGAVELDEPRINVRCQSDVRTRLLQTADQIDESLSADIAHSNSMAPLKIGDVCF